MHRKDIISELLAHILCVTGFDVARLYVLNPVRKIAVLRYVVEKDNVYNVIDESWEPLFEIPFNYKDLFSGKHCTDNVFANFILNFNNKKAFPVDLNTIENTPAKINKFHSSKNIKNILLCKLCKSEEEFIGHIVVDKSYRDDQNVSTEEIRKFELYVGNLSSSIINALEKYEREHQIKKYYSLINHLMTRFDSKTNEANHILKNFIDSILNVCESIDILQIKEMIPNSDKFKLSEIRVNERSDIDETIKNKIEGMKGNEYEIKDGHIVSQEVLMSMKSIFIRDMRKKEYYGSGTEKFEQDDPRRCVFERNLCEINIPLVFGDKVYGILDVHAKRPYSLNENTELLLKDISPWITLLLKTKEYQLNINTANIKEKISSYNEYIWDTDAIVKYKRSEISRVYHVDDLKMSLNNAIYQNILYRHSAYKSRASNSRFSKLIALCIFGLSSVSIISFVFAGLVLIDPILSIFGAITATTLTVMSSRAEKENSINYERFTKYIGEFTNTN